jgi:hypothetical protein
MSRSTKPVVKTLKELYIQKALGNDVVMCSRCEDVGTYDYRDVYNSDSGCPCIDCEMGWPFVWKMWLAKLNHKNGFPKCSEHPEYNGNGRPTVSCDACWKIWFEAPKKPEELIQNKEVFK